MYHFTPSYNQHLSWGFLSSFFGMCQIVLKYLKNKLAGIAKKILKMMYNERRFAFPDIKCTQMMLIKTMWFWVQEHTHAWNRVVQKHPSISDDLVHKEWRGWITSYIPNYIRGKNIIKAFFTLYTKINFDWICLNPKLIPVGCISGWMQKGQTLKKKTMKSRKQLDLIVVGKSTEAKC
jgi:hypothetical protein